MPRVPRNSAIPGAMQTLALHNHWTGDSVDQPPRGGGDGTSLYEHRTGMSLNYFCLAIISAARAWLTAESPFDDTRQMPNPQ
jgi:hypothetical protein